MRTFIALPLPDPLVFALEPLLEQLPVGRIVPPENLHLTLAFLDEQPDHMLQAVHEALELVQFPAFPLQLRGLGTFGDRRPHSVWADIAEPSAPGALHRRVLGALHSAGLDLPRRRFRPHVTLAALPQLVPDEEQKLARFLERRHSYPAPEVLIDRFALYRSILGKGDPVYEILADYPLSGGALSAGAGAAALR